MKYLSQKDTIKTELVKQFSKQGSTALYAGEFVAAIIFFGLYDHTGFFSLLAWFSTITIITIARLFLGTYLKKRLTHKFSRKFIHHYAFYYTAGALCAGLAWSSLIFFYHPSQAVILQVFILVIVIGMPTAALSTNAILPSAFYAFTIPHVAAVIIWSLFLTPVVEIKFLLTAIVYSFLVISTGNQFHRNLYLSILRRFENQHLVEELRKGNLQLQELAYRDHLTDLPNRRQFQINAERTLAKIKKSDSSMALMLIDVDNFKHINDNYGHEAGDELLMEISHRINDSIRPNDMMTRSEANAARLGGDEFIVMLECEHDDIDAEPVANRILKNIRTPVILNETDVIPRVSIGIALAPKHSDDLRTLMGYADQAMYETKQHGGNGYSIYEEDDLSYTQPVAI